MTDNVDQPSGVIGAEMVQMGAEEVGGQSLQYPSLSGPLPLDNSSHHKNQQFYSKWVSAGQRRFGALPTSWERVEVRPKTLNQYNEESNENVQKASSINFEAV